jgi:hypothetical protein
VSIPLDVTVIGPTIDRIILAFLVNILKKELVGYKQFLQEAKVDSCGESPVVDAEIVKEASN